MSAKSLKGLIDATKIPKNCLGQSDSLENICSIDIFYYKEQIKAVFIL